jgi:hypothetical protein
MRLARFPPRSDEEVNIMATEMACQQAEDDVAAFEHEGKVAR